MIPIKPYSSGVKRRASTRPTKKVIPCPAILSIKLQLAPFTVLCFNDSSAIYLRIYKLKYLFPFIHFLIILFILTRSDVVHPLLVFEIPSYGLLYAFLELQTWPSALRRQRSSASPHCGRMLSTSYKCLVRPSEFALKDVSLLSFRVHFFVIGLIVTRGYVLKPFLII